MTANNDVGRIYGSLGKGQKFGAASDADAAMFSLIRSRSGSFRSQRLKEAAEGTEGGPRSTILMQVAVAWEQDASVARAWSALGLLPLSVSAQKYEQPDGRRWKRNDGSKGGRLPNF